MLSVTRPTPVHFGIYATDPDLLVNFYTRVFALTQTDRGQGKTFPVDLIFLSASPDQHHQLVIAGGRPKEATFSTVMQISFVVPSIQSMREIRQRIRVVSRRRPYHHWSARHSFYSLQLTVNWAA